MNKFKVLGIFLLLVLVNIFVINIRNVAFLLIIGAFIYSISLIFNLHQEIIRRIRLFLFLGIFILLFQLAFNHVGTVLQRLTLGLSVILEIAIISESVFVVMKIISPAEIVKSLNFLPKSIQILLSMTFYFIPLLMKEYEYIRLVQRSRGLGSTLISRLFSAVYIIIPLLHRVFQRSETITYTILSRGFEI